MKICTVPVHGFSAPKLDWPLPKLGGMCCIPRENQQQECIDVASDSMFACSDITKADLGTALIENYVHGTACR